MRDKSGMDHPLQPLTSDRFRMIATADPINATLLDRLPDLGFASAVSWRAACSKRCGITWPAAPRDGGSRTTTSSTSTTIRPGRQRTASSVVSLIWRPTSESASKSGTRPASTSGSRRGSAATTLPLASSHQGIDRFLVAATCVGIDVASRAVYASDGFADLAAARLRMNPRQSHGRHNSRPRPRPTGRAGPSCRSSSLERRQRFLS